MGAGERAIVESAREVCGSVRVGGGNPKSVWRHNEVKSVVRRKEAALKEVLGVRDEDAKDKMFGSLPRRKREKLKCIYQSKNKINEQFGRKMNQNVNGNRKFFWK